MKTICLVCGKKGNKVGKPVIIAGKELASHILCSEKCRKIYEAKVGTEIAELIKGKL